MTLNVAAVPTMAADLGFMKREGIDVKIVQFDGTPQALAALEKGNVQMWRAGGPSPSRMSAAGWDKDTLKPGDTITAVGNRISDGTYVLRLSKVVLSNGKELRCYGNTYGP